MPKHVSLFSLPTHVQSRTGLACSLWCIHATTSETWHIVPVLLDSGWCKHRGQFPCSHFWMLSLASQIGHLRLAFPAQPSIDMHSVLGSVSILETGSLLTRDSFWHLEWPSNRPKKLSLADTGFKIGSTGNSELVGKNRTRSDPTPQSFSLPAPFCAVPSFFQRGLRCPKTPPPEVSAHVHTSE